MNPGLAGAALEFSWRALPCASAVLLILLAQMPAPLPFYPDVTPALALIAIYFWAVFQPNLVPRVLVFALGLFHDALIGTPFGLSALVYLVTREFVLSQRKSLAGKPFWIFWGGFIIVGIFATALNWLLASILRGALLPVDVVLAGLLLTLLAFPVVVWILLRGHSWLSAAVQSA